MTDSLINNTYTFHMDSLPRSHQSKFQSYWANADKVKFILLPITKDCLKVIIIDTATSEMSQN